MKKLLGIVLSCVLLLGLLSTISLADTYSKQAPLLGVLLDGPTVLMGDPDGDGDVTMKDVLMVRKFVAKMIDSISEAAADVNRDGSVDMKDVLLIRKFIARMIPSFEPETPTTTTTASTTTQPTTTTTTAPVPETFFTYDTDQKNGSLGVWWWDCRTGIGESNYKPRLDFLQNNRVTEIYLWVNPARMTNDQIAEFIHQAADRGMRVAWLSGDVSWIREDNTGFETFFEQFKAYQDQAADDAKFYGIHLDVEPHQAGSSDDNWQLYANLVLRATATAHEYGTVIEWDVPFWLDDMKVTVDGSSVKLLNVLAANSDTLCLMAYRDTASAILSVSEQEIPLGTENNCKIVLGVETYSREGEYVSFLEDGKAVMYNALAAVLTDLSGRSTLDAGYGCAVHFIENWMRLKN